MLPERVTVQRSKPVWQPLGMTQSTAFFRRLNIHTRFLDSKCRRNEDLHVGEEREWQ